MVDAQEFWENRYSESATIWSGRVNQALSVTVHDLAPGTALDLGCGEGADAIWLARRGWTVTGLDLSETALTRARLSAEKLGFAVEFDHADLAVWQASTTYDLVTATFLHSPVPGFPRTAVLAQAAAAVAPGGHLLVVGHATVPPGAGSDHHHSDDPDQQFIGAQEQVRRLGLDPEQWSIVVAEDRARGMHDATGAPFVVQDAVVLASRHGGHSDLG